MALQSNDFQYLSGLIKENSGITITPDKEYLLESRLVPIATKYNLSNLSELVSYCRENSDKTVFEEIVEAMTTNESLFFRDTKPFEALKDLIIPRIIGKCPDKRHIKIWSAACSTGQEPYSIAMTILEDPLLASLTFDILATDIDKNVLDKASEGRYSQFEVQRGVPINLLIKYFTQNEEHWFVKDVLKEKVAFQKFNLLDKPDFGCKFDIIFCRNVLIYFDQDTKSKIICNMQELMERHSALVLGSSENVINLDGCVLNHIRVKEDKVTSGVFGFVADS